MDSMTAGQVVDIIRQMTNSGDPALQAHGATLLGPRTRGSTTEVGLEDIPQDTLLTDASEHLADEVKIHGCRYFNGISLELGGKLGVVPLYLIKPEMLPLIKRRIGEHGDELYLDKEQDPKTGYCLMFTVVMGPVDEYFGFPMGAVYTWHPGMPLLPLKNGEDAVSMTAVKLHRG